MTDAPDPTPPTGAARTWRGAPRWLKIAFVVSIVLNFLVVGLAAGAAMRVQFNSLTEGRSFAMKHLLRHVPEDRRDAAKARLGAARGEIGDRRGARRVARGALADAIAAEPFDKAAVDAAFAGLRAADQSLRETTHASMSDLIAELTPEDRVKMAEWMKKPRWGKHHRKDRERGD